jgi:hypothetical protein
MTEFIRAIVRPATTFGLVAVQAGLAIMWANGVDASDAFAALAPFTMMTVTFWFKSRTDQENGGG